MMSQIGAWLQTQIATNEFFAGGLVMGAFTYLAVAARAWPARFIGLVKQVFSTSVTITSDTDEKAHRDLCTWLAQHPGVRRARKIGVVSKEKWDHRRDEDMTEYTPTFGFGRHLIWVGMMPVMVERRVNEDAVRPVHTIEMSIPGRSQKLLLDILAKAAVVEAKERVQRVFVWKGSCWRMLATKKPRHMETIIDAHGAVEEVRRDMEQFLADEEWYAERGVPWRRGYLLTGPPGTGKSSLIGALAAMANKDVRILNLSSITDDSDLMAAVTEAGSDAIVLEDVDAISISHDRKTRTKGEAKGPTLAGLLNAIDGVGSVDGRLVFLTSNHPDRLDAALLRPGRVDMRVELGLLERDRATLMWDRFFPGECPDAFLACVPSWPVSPAFLQESLLRWRERRVEPVQDQRRQA